MVGVLKKLPEVGLPVGGAEHMDFFIRHFLPAQPGLKQAAGLGAGKVLTHKGIALVVGKGLLGQQHLTAGALHKAGKNPAVFLQLGFLQNIGRAGKACKFLRAFHPGKGRSCLHQGTSTGSKFSCRGRPYLSRASRKGSGSNSSTV